MTGVLRWEEPPPATHTGRHSPWGLIAAELREHPGEWALVAEGVPHASTASNIKAGKLKDFPQGQFEASSRIRPDRSYDVFARFVGGA